MQLRLYNRMLLALGTATRDKTYEEALKEMMERIQSGRALKPTVSEVRICFLFYIYLNSTIITD